MIAQKYGRDNVALVTMFNKSYTAAAVQVRRTQTCASFPPSPSDPSKPHSPQTHSQIRKARMQRRNNPLETASMSRLYVRCAQCLRQRALRVLTGLSLAATATMASTAQEGSQRAPTTLTLVALGPAPCRDTPRLRHGGGDSAPPAPKATPPPLTGALLSCKLS